MAKEIAGSRCLPARRPVGSAKTASSRDEEKKIIFNAVKKRRLVARE